MGDNYSAAIDFALSHEGGYVDDPSDPGGPTNYGITLATLQDWARRGDLVHDGLDLDVNGDGHIDVRDIRAMSRAFAIAFYRDFVWVPLHVDQVTDPKIAAKLLDEAINLGPSGIARITRNALVACGVRGAITIATLPAAVPTINAQDPVRYMIWLKRALVVNYDRIVQARPADEKFLKGWIARANA